MAKNAKIGGVAAGLLMIVLSGSTVRGAEPIFEFKIPDGIWDLTISPNSKHIAVNGIWGFGGEALSIWNIKTGKRVAEFDYHFDRINIRGATFSPDGRMLAACLPGEVRVWETDKWRVVHNLKADGRGTAHCLAFSPDGKILATGELDQGTTNRLGSPVLWNLESGRLSKVLTTEKILLGYRPARASTIDYSADGKYLVCKIGGMRLYTWKNGTANREMQEVMTLRGEAFGADFSSDGKRLVVQTIGDLRVLETGTWKEIQRIKIGRKSIRQIQSVPKSNLVAVLGDPNGKLTLDLFDLATGKSRRVIDFKDHFVQEPANLRRVADRRRVRFACSPDGTKIVVSRNLTELSVWSIKEEK